MTGVALQSETRPKNTKCKFRLPLQHVEEYHDWCRVLQIFISPEQYKNASSAHLNNTQHVKENHDWCRVVQNFTIEPCRSRTPRLALLSGSCDDKDLGCFT